jgi:hypothetical protein
MNDMVLMPKELTAENGAKALLIGEFHVETKVPNPDYDAFLDDEDEEPEFFTAQIPVPWDTIKKIYAMAVQHLARPLEEDDDPQGWCGHCACQSCYDAKRKNDW